MIWKYRTFIYTNLNNLYKYAPLKKKYLIANHSTFTTKELSQEIMKWSKLRNGYLESKTETARLEYEKWRNLCVTLLKKAKRSYHENFKYSTSYWQQVVLELS